ncbi:MAG TPA: RsmB/NOP family class I SAM-dependent RNA methyltransferase [Casimicrobiaceae bacterium]|nr:RsmB/NOP family class I SAM-dependent RNA methyltransferase [Casimicrobiaceae bacterium]
MTVRASQLGALTDALAAALPFKEPADSVLRGFFRHHRGLGQDDRAFIAEGVFAALRRLASLRAQAGSGSPRRLAIAVTVRELGASLREIEGALSTAETAWAKEFKAAKPVLSPAESAELPEWLWDKLSAALPASERDALTRSWLMTAPLDLRVNTMKITRDQAQAQLESSGIESEPTPYSPLGLRVGGKPALQSHPLFTSGAIEVQDEGSQLLGLLVAPRRTDMVVDFCAGAGGKTMLLGALMRSQGRLYAFDVSRARLARFKPRLARSGLSNVQPTLIENERDTHIKRLAGKIDRVLVDAPCSGFGTLRRNPDLKWRQAADAIPELAIKQARILAAAATLVKPGGRLVYATCSVLPDENEAIVEAFVGAHPEFALGDAAAELRRAGVALDTGRTLKLSTPRHGCDGFFAAVLERAA